MRSRFLSASDSESQGGAEAKSRTSITSCKRWRLIQERALLSYVRRELFRPIQVHNLVVLRPVGRITAQTVKATPEVVMAKQRNPQNDLS